MAHLLKIRKGWENKNLARFILSKFSFVAQPSTIADDLGADFFCTFFIKFLKERKNKKNKRIKDVFIYPKHSFAIQIKSGSRHFDLTDKLGFFDNLELPFFIGVVSQQKLSITIYSGDVIPELLSLVGPLPSDTPVKAALLEARGVHGQQAGQAKYVVPFFKVGEIFAADTDEMLRPFIEKFSAICLNYQANIVSKKKQQYIFHDAVTLVPQIVSGPGSYRVCRSNFINSLVEVLYNLVWAAPQSKNNEEFIQECDLYKKLNLEIKKVYGENPVLEECFQRLENALR